MGGVVPIGVVASDVGGVKIETLMSEEALVDETCGGTAYAPSASYEWMAGSSPAAPAQALLHPHER